eukprot:TRINITY_DN609_c0_g1_i1.p1 TRINITY_DN609_c0_g1~~TRINITY_DN609_c0_g1_i1.p1  ORF type:complete len:156 (+),score=50.30 TRINITY_DN609_c0_g1_i1:18-485(+)
MDGLEGKKISELKAILQQHHIDSSSCIEKADLINLIRSHKLVPQNNNNNNNGQNVNNDQGKSQPQTRVRSGSKEKEGDPYQRGETKPRSSSKENCHQDFDYKSEKSLKEKVKSFEKEPDDSKGYIGKKYEFRNVDIAGLQKNVKLDGLRGKHSDE